MKTKEKTDPSAMIETRNRPVTIKLNCQFCQGEIDRVLRRKMKSKYTCGNCKQTRRAAYHIQKRDHHKKNTDVKWNFETKKWDIVPFIL